MKRCVISPGSHMEQLAGGAISSQTILTVQDLNYYALFWDEILIPTSRAVHEELPNEKEYIGLGVIRRPILEYWSTEGLPKKYLEFSNQLLAERREGNRTEDWSLHQIGHEFITLEEKKSSMSGIRFEIFNALPIPNAEVPLADILEFKHRKNQAFVDFHGYLDEIYEKLISSPDDPLLKSKSYLKFEESISIIKKLSDDEWRGRLEGYKFSWGFESQKEKIEALIDGVFAFMSLSAGDYASGTKDFLSIAAKNLKVQKKESVMLGSKEVSKGLTYLVEGYREKMF